LGNVRTDQIKRTARELVRRFPDKFTNTFEENKRLVNLLVEGSTTKIRNQIAGYITRYLACEEVEESEDMEESEEEDESS